MTQHFSEDELKRAKRSQLQWGIGCLIASIATIGVTGINSKAMSWSYWGDFFGGAELVSNQNLISEPNKYLGRYIKVVGSGNTETGLQSIEKIKYKEYVSRVIAIKLSETSNRNNTLLVQLKDDVPVPVDNSVTGTILPIPSFRMDDTAKSLTMKKSILPIVLDTTSDFRGVGIVNLGFSLIFGVAGVVILSKKQR
jgi:hypothetical protein